MPLIREDSIDEMTPGLWHPGRAFNPFSVQRHGPGNVEYVFESGAQKKSLFRLLNESRWRVELVGGHGVGKSTLLRTLEDLVRKHRRETRWLRCSGDMPKLPLLFWRDLPRRGGVVFLDGGERCPLWQLWLLAWMTRRRRSGLVLTTHISLGIARPWRVRAGESQLHRVVEELLEVPLDEGRRRHLDKMLANHRGSARDVLFRLYDEWEERGRE